MPHGDSTCKYCRAPIRWVELGQSIRALDFEPITEGTIIVIGSETAMQCPKDKRAAAAGRLYGLHSETCLKREDVAAFRQRQADDRAERAHMLHNREAELSKRLPTNVIPLNDWRPKP
jgi:hypothetical protein